MLWIILAILAAGLVLLLTSGDSGTVMGMADNQFARLVYLGAIGIAVGAGVLFYGGPVRGALRSAAIWLFLLLVLVAGYQYRHELQDIGHQLTLGLVPASPNTDP